MASYQSAPPAMSPEQVYEAWKSEQNEIENGYKSELARLEDKLARDQAMMEAEFEKKRRVIPPGSASAPFMSQYLHDQQATELKRMEQKHSSRKQELEKAFEAKKQSHMEGLIKRLDAAAAVKPPAPAATPVSNNHRPGQPPSRSTASYDTGPSVEQQYPSRFGRGFGIAPPRPQPAHPQHPQAQPPQPQHLQAQPPQPQHTQAQPPQHQHQQSHPPQYRQQQQAGQYDQQPAQHYSPPRQPRQLRQPAPLAQAPAYQHEQHYQRQKHPDEPQQRTAHQSQQYSDRPPHPLPDHQHAQAPQRPIYQQNRPRPAEAPSEFSRPAHTQSGYNMSVPASAPPPSSAPPPTRQVPSPAQYETRTPNDTEHRFWKGPTDANWRAPTDTNNGPRYSPSQAAGIMSPRPAIATAHQAPPSPPTGFRPPPGTTPALVAGPASGPVPILASQPLPSPILPVPEVPEPSRGPDQERLKRKAELQQSPPSGQGPAKKAKAEESTPRADAAGQTSPQPAPAPTPTPTPATMPKRTISFDEVYQDGAPEHQAYHMIVEYPPGKGNWYILKCDEHGVYFNANPLHGAAKHLHSPQHDMMSKEHSQAIEYLGHLVFDCDADLAAKNNAMVKEYFGSGHKPFNRNQLTKTERVKRGLEPAGVVRSPATPREYKPRGPQLNPHVKAEPKYRTRGFPGIMYPVPAELYLGYWSKNKTKYGVLVLPWRDLAPCGIAGYLKNTNLLARAPKCYVISEDGEIEGWAPGFEDGGPLVTKRDFPVMYYDGHRSVGWLRAKDLSSFPFEGGVNYAIPHFEEAREAYAAARGFASYEAWKQDRRRQGLPEKTESDVQDPTASPSNSPVMGRHVPTLSQESPGMHKGMSSTPFDTGRFPDNGRPNGPVHQNQPQRLDIGMENAALDDADSHSNHNSVTKDIARSDDDANMDDTESRLTSVPRKAGHRDDEHPGADKTFGKSAPTAQVSKGQANPISAPNPDSPAADRVMLPERPYNGFPALNGTKATERPFATASLTDHAANGTLGSQINHDSSSEATMVTDATLVEKKTSADPATAGPQTGHHVPTASVVRPDDGGQSSRWRAVRAEATANTAQDVTEAGNAAQPEDLAEPNEATPREPSPPLATVSKESSPLTPLTDSSTTPVVQGATIKATAAKTEAPVQQPAATTRAVGNGEEWFELAFYENTDGITWNREPGGPPLSMVTDTASNTIKTVPGQSFDLTIDPNGFTSMTVEPLDAESEACLVTLEGSDGDTVQKIVFEPSDVGGTGSIGRIHARRFLGWLNRRRNVGLKKMAYFNKTHNPLQKPITSYIRARD